jgi:hypothetical protein
MRPVVDQYEIAHSGCPKKSPQTFRLRANPIQGELEETGSLYRKCDYKAALFPQYLLSFSLISLLTEPTVGATAYMICLNDRAPLQTYDQRMSQPEQAMSILDDHQVPPEPIPDNAPLPDQDPAPDEDPVPDHNPVTARDQTR